MPHSLLGHTARCVRDGLKNTVSPFFKDFAGDTPLHDAISKEKNTIVDLILVSQSLDVTVCNNRGFNPLHQACMKGNKQ